MRIFCRTVDTITVVYAGITDAFVIGFAVRCRIASACLQVAFAAFAVFKAFASALFLALVIDAFFIRAALAVARAASRFIDAGMVFDFLACTATRDFDALAFRTVFVGGAVGTCRTLRFRRRARITYAVRTVGFLGFRLVGAAGCFVPHFGAGFQDAFAVFALFTVVAVGIRRTFGIAGIALFAVGRRSRGGLLFTRFARCRQSHVGTIVFNACCSA